MAPLKTKRLSSFDEPDVKAREKNTKGKGLAWRKLSPELKARRTSSRMAVKIAFAKAKNRPRTSMSNPLIIDSVTAEPHASDLPPHHQDPPFTPPHHQNPPVTPPHHQNPPVTALPQPNHDSPPSVGNENAAQHEVDKGQCRVRIFQGSRPKITNKRKLISSKPVEKQAKMCPSQARFRYPSMLKNPTPPDHSHSTPPPKIPTNTHQLPICDNNQAPTPSLHSSPRRPAPQRSTQPVGAPLHSSPRRPAPQRSTSHVTASHAPVP